MVVVLRTERKAEALGAACARIWCRGVVAMWGGGDTRFCAFASTEPSSRATDLYWDPASVSRRRSDACDRVTPLDRMVLQPMKTAVARASSSPVPTAIRYRPCYRLVRAGTWVALTSEGNMSSTVISITRLSYL